MRHATPGRAILTHNLLAYILKQHVVWLKVHYGKFFTSITF